MRKWLYLKFSEDYFKATLLSFGFFLIILCYTIARNVRSGILITELGTESLPYVWTATGILMGVFVVAYGRLSDFFSRQWIISGTAVGFTFSLVLIRYLMTADRPWMSGVFYVWGDLFSVILVEQFWSISNEIFRTIQAKKLYGFINTGGIVGSILGNLVVTTYVHDFGSLNLIYGCIGLLVLLIGLILFLGNFVRPRPPHVRGGVTNLLSAFKVVSKNRYLMLLLSMVLLSQVISNLIDYQFNFVLEGEYSTMDLRTEIYGKIYLWVSLLSLFISLFLAGPLQYYFGVLASLSALPVANFISLVIYQTLGLPSAMFGLRIVDKIFNYSINRTAKELLYIPLSSDEKFKAKAVIDMFAYRFSKIFGSAVIIPLTAVLSVSLLNYVNMTLLLVSLWVVFLLHRKYLEIHQAK